MRFENLVKKIQSELINSSASIEDVTNCFLSLGLVNTGRPELTIQLASNLHSYFDAIQCDLPNLSHVLKNFKLPKEFTELRYDKPYSFDAQINTRIDWISNSKMNSYFDIGNYLGSEDELKIPQMTSCYAVLWLARSLTEYIPHSLRTQTSVVQNKVASFSSVVYFIREWSQNSAKLQAPFNEIIDIGFFKWFNHIQKEIENNFRDDIQDSRIRNVIEAGRFLIELDSDIGKLGLAPRKIEDHNATPSYKRNFSARNLLKSHWNTPRKIEIDQLKRLLSNLSKLIKKSARRSEPEIYESIIVGLSLCTGCSIAEVLALPIHWESEEFDITGVSTYLYVDRGVNFRSNPWIVRKIKNPINNTWMSLPLPPVISNAILDTLPIISVSRFVYLFPISSVYWEDRCHLLIKTKLLISSERAGMIVRDYLARELFNISSNEAVVRLVCTPPTNSQKSSSLQQIALTYYLDLEIHEIWDTYEKACSALFSFEDLPSDHRLKTEKNSYLTKHTLNPQKISLISNFLLDRANQSSEIATKLAEANHIEKLIDEHNKIAEYTLFLLVVSTGHRKSKSPLYFPWDILCEEKLAFVCDKQVIGSEARIIPLPQIAIDQYQTYLVHLHTSLSKFIALKAFDAARHVEALINAYVNLPSRAREIYDPICSQFFWIDEKKQPQTIDTNRLDKLILNAHIPNLNTDISVLKIRNELADYLWRKLNNGTEIQAWLGHASEMHPFGETSTWNMLSLPNKIRPHIESYLKECGLSQTTESSSTTCALTVFKPNGTLSYKSGIASYEGRSISKKHAADRARKVLKKMLPEELLESHQHFNLGGSNATNKNIEIDNALLKHLEKELREKLGGDRQALGAVNQTLASELYRLSTQGVKVSATAANLIRTDAGPININFSRHLWIANQLRNEWVKEWLSKGLDQEPRKQKDNSKSLEKRIAQLAISLVIFDSTLDPIRVKALSLASLKNDSLRAHPNTLTLRAHIRTDRDIYDWLILPSPLTTAQILGIKRCLKDSTQFISKSTAKELGQQDPKTIVMDAEEDSIDEDKLWKKVEIEVSFLLRNMQHGQKHGAVLEIADLCLVFRPWWQLRLPGAIFAIASGDYVGSAPSRESELSLFAVCEPEPFAKNRNISKNSLDIQLPAEKARKLVSDSVNKIFNLCDAALSRTQRSKLRQELSKPYEPTLLKYVDEQPIVRHALGFIEYLLSVGGLQQPYLKFNSIRTYYSNAMPVLLEAWWDQDFTEWSTDEFNEAYRKIIYDSKGKKSLNAESKAAASILNALRQFHRYLRDTTDAPFCSLLFQEAQPARRRSEILTQNAIANAIEDIQKNEALTPLARSEAASFIAVCAGFGLRNSEAASLTTKSFGHIEKPHLSLFISRNRFADMKTPAARRVIARPLMNGSLIKITSRALEKAKITEKRDIDSSKDARLFSATDEPSIWRQNQLSQHCIASLRRSSACNATVLHSLRHTFATNLMLELFSDVSENEEVGLTNQACITARKRLLGTLHKNANVKEMLQLPESWPYGVDSAAQAIGHTDVSTFLDFYFHGSPILLAEMTHKYSRYEELIDDRLSVLLNLERSSITKRRLAAKNSTKIDKSHPSLLSSIEQLINVDIEKLSKPIKRISASQNTSSPIKLNTITWETLNDLLTIRAECEYSLETMKEGMQHLSNDSALSDLFIKSYVGIIENSSFDDFEFKNSELVDHAPKRSSGVSRSTNERRRCLRLLEAACHNNKRLLADLHLLTEIWMKRVDAQSPWLVLKNENEGHALIHCLSALNESHESPAKRELAFANQLTIYSTGTPDEKLLQYFRSLNLNIQYETKLKRFSRSVINIKTSEVGIQFLQHAGAVIGDGRDAHRLFFVLAVALKTLSN